MGFSLNALFSVYKEEKSGGIYNLLGVIAIVVVWVVAGGILEAVIQNYVTRHYGVQDMSYITIIHNVITTGFSLLVVLLGARFLLRHSFGSLGFSAQNLLGHYGKGIVIGLAMFSFCVLVGVFLGTQTVSLNDQSIAWGMWLAFFGLFFVQGLSEEVMFRSFLLPEISARFGLLAGLIGSNILFALFHAGNAGSGTLPVVNMFLFGLVMSILYYYTQSIWVSGAVHSIWNFAEGNIYGISISGHEVSNETLFKSRFSGSEWLTGGAFGLEGGLICSFGLIVAGAVLIYVYRGRRGYGATP
ncbi:MAG: hypothetical protein CR993_04545 [Rhodobacterales bacterium]|nr:MAG: hypothetical protein CR993_04545 [Rhodobacterales bacterium]